MITSQEYEARFAAPAGPRAAAPAATSLLHFVLFVTILISPLVFIEPAPYEFAAGLLGLACVFAGVPLDRRVLPLVVLLIIWNFGAIVALIGVLDQDKTVRYTLISLFMGFSAVVYACLFAQAQQNMPRLVIMRRTYIIAACLASIAGTIGYFNLIPGSADLLAPMARVRSTFKDPNVFGPFLILPLLMLIYSLLIERVRLRHVAACLCILLGLFLAFSRGAWVHSAISAACMILLMFVTAPNSRTRARLTLFTMLAIGALAALIVFALSFDAIGDMFKVRAKFVQDYDTGSSMSRFHLQGLGLSDLLDHPLGMGAYEFVRIHGLQQHNQYLQAFLVYGWVGGLSYLALVLLTLAIGWRAALVATPWQPYAITTFSVFLGEVLEGFVIDTDHWRHFFLLLGAIWGLAAATFQRAGIGPSRPLHRPARSFSTP